jgi:hypothetical protein
MDMIGIQFICDHAALLDSTANLNLINKQLAKNIFDKIRLAITGIHRNEVHLFRNVIAFLRIAVIYHMVLLFKSWGMPMGVRWPKGQY